MSSRSKIDTYLRGTGAGVASTVIQKGAGFASIWLLNQVLVKADYGDYAFSLTVVSLLLLLGSGGIHEAVLYRLSRRDDEESDDDGNVLIGREYVGIALGWSLVLAVAVLAAVNVGLPYVLATPDEQRIVFWLSGLSLLIPLKVSNRVYKAWYQSRQRIPEALFFHNMLPSACKMAFLAGVWVLYPTPTAVIAGVVLSEVVAMGWWYARSPVNPFLLYEGMARSEVSYAMKLAFTSGLSKSAARTDVFMLGLLGGSKATAEYVVAYKFSLILASAGQNMLNTILRPRLGKLLGEGRTSRLQREYDQVRLASLGIALLIAAGYVVLGREVLGLFGAYEMAYPVLLILTARHVIGIGFGKSSAYLKMAGYAGWAMSTVALMLGLNVVLNGLLVPAYGTGGAAVATLTTGLLVGTFKVGLVYRLDDVPLYSVSLAAFVAASVGVLFLAAGGVLAPAAAAPALLLLLAGVLAWNWATLEPAVRRVVDRGREMVER